MLFVPLCEDSRELFFTYAFGVRMIYIASHLVYVLTLKLSFWYTRGTRIKLLRVSWASTVNCRLLFRRVVLYEIKSDCYLYHPLAIDKLDLI